MIRNAFKLAMDTTGISTASWGTGAPGNREYLTLMEVYGTAWVNLVSLPQMEEDSGELMLDKITESIKAPIVEV